MARFTLTTTNPTLIVLACKLERNTDGGFMLKARSVSHAYPNEINAREAARLVGLPAVDLCDVVVGSRYAMIPVSAEAAAATPILAELVKVLELEAAAKAAAAAAALAESTEAAEA